MSVLMIPGQHHLCHPIQPESMEGRDTCGAGTTSIGAWSVVALHKWILGTRRIREVALIYISAAGRAARRGHPASITDTVVLGLPQKTPQCIFKAFAVVKKNAGGVNFIKLLSNYNKKAFRALHGLYILFCKLL